MRVCSGLLIGRSAPPPRSTHGARRHDSTHGETTSWGCRNLANEGPRVKLTLTTDITSRCKWRQLRPGGTTPDYPLPCRGDDYQSTVAEQSETILQQRCHSIAKRGHQVKSALTSPRGARGTTPIKGRRLKGQTCSCFHARTDRPA